MAVNEGPDHEPGLGLAPGREQESPIRTDSVCAIREPRDEDKRICEANERRRAAQPCDPHAGEVLLRKLGLGEPADPCVDFEDQELDDAGERMRRLDRLFTYWEDFRSSSNAVSQASALVDFANEMFHFRAQIEYERELGPIAASRRLALQSFLDQQYAEHGPINDAARAELIRDWDAARLADEAEP